jgi:hypothetical protein
MPFIFRMDNDFFNELAHHDRGDFRKVSIASNQLHKPFGAYVIVLIFVCRRIVCRGCNCFSKIFQGKTALTPSFLSHDL